MPAPGIAIVILNLLAKSTTQVLTKPHVWLFFLGWFAISKFDLKIFGEEVRKTVEDLWWLVLLIIIAIIIIAAIKSYFSLKLTRK